MAATNVDLAAARARGRFRDDLYYRLSVYEIVVPPLRKRGPADIRALIATVLQRFGDRRRMSVPTIDAQAMDRLLGYRWPGNVRELENTLERMLVEGRGQPVLGIAHLPDHLRLGEGRHALLAAGGSDARTLGSAALGTGDGQIARIRRRPRSFAPSTVPPDEAARAAVAGRASVSRAHCCRRARPR
jgi:two-component system, NtrC family, response regulator AtoC